MSTYGTDSADRTDSTSNTYSTDPEPSFPGEYCSSDSDVYAQTEKNIPLLLPLSEMSEGNDDMGNANENPANILQSSERSMTLSNAEVVMHRKEVELRTQLAGTYALRCDVLCWTILFVMIYFCK